MLRDHGDSVLRGRDLGEAAGAQRTALRCFDLPAGKTGAPPHCHSGCEELFVVLAGSGVYLDQAAGAVGWDPQEHSVRRGDVVSVPAGTGIAHAFRAGADGLTFLAYGNRDSDDVICIETVTYEPGFPYPSRSPNAAISSAASASICGSTCE